MLPGIVFNKGQGGLSRPLAGQDYISGLTFYCANGSLPSGWTSSKRTVCLYQTRDANTNGILPNYNPNNLLADSNYADATAAISTIDITTEFEIGDIITVQCIVPAQLVNTSSNQAYIGAKTITLCVYTILSSDSSATIQASSIKTAINNNTYLTGFSATSSTATISVSAPKAYGISLNGSNTLVGADPFIVTNSNGSSTGVFVLDQPAAATPGTQSLQAIWYYHISEYFRLQPQGQLYVSFYAVNSAYTFTELTTIQTGTQGIIRQMAVYMGNPSYTHAFTIGDTTAINTEIVTNDDGANMPMSVLYSADMVTTYSASLSTLPNLNNYNNNKVSIILGQDGAAQGAFLFTTAGYSISCIGAALGAASLANVQEDIGWLAKFNMTNGSELNTPALSNGQLIGAPGISANYLTAIDASRYIILLTYVGNSGVFFNDSHCACALSSDYAYLENNRVIDKADRGLYASILPQLKGPLLLNADGTLADTTIAYLTGLAYVPLDAMVTAGNLSDREVTIPTAQLIQQTGSLAINVYLEAIGISRNIKVNIGYVLQLP